MPSARALAVESALAGIREGLVADGYDLRIEQLEGTVLRLAVLAGSDACEDCLVPKDVLSGIIRGSLDELGQGLDLELSYPNDAQEPTFPHI